MIACDGESNYKGHGLERSGENNNYEMCDGRRELIVCGGGKYSLEYGESLCAVCIERNKVPLGD